VRRLEQAPWIPNEDVWQRILFACAEESLRNRLMVTLAYDGALRREELVQLDVGDFEHARRLIHLRAETTKFQRAREVAFGVTSSQLFLAYLNERRGMFGRIDGPLFRSDSNREPPATQVGAYWARSGHALPPRHPMTVPQPRTWLLHWSEPAGKAARDPRQPVSLVP
jgi:integrase